MGLLMVEDEGSAPRLAERSTLFADAADVCLRWPAKDEAEFATRCGAPS